MDGVLGALVALASIVVVFLICRAIVLWYWRINDVVTLLKSIDEKLGVLAANSPRVPSIGDLRP